LGILLCIGNLSRALASIESVLDKLDGKVIITADHGESFGTDGIYGHERGSKLSELREVPFLTVSKKPVATIEPKEKMKNKNVEHKIVDNSKDPSLRKILNMKDSDNLVEKEIAPGVRALVVERDTNVDFNTGRNNNVSVTNCRPYTPKLWKRVPDNYVYVDVGAFIGRTVNSTIKMYPNYRYVLALEPFSINFSRLRQNVKLDPNIILINKGCWDERKIVPIYNSDKYSGISINKQEHHGDILEYVEIDTLDNILNDYGIPEPDMVKIDTENSEPWVLRGFTKYKNGTQLHVETHDYNHDEVLNILINKNFKILESGTSKKQGTILAVYGDING